MSRYYCFPDIHGCFSLLDKALYQVYLDNPDGGKIIFLGDYIDRGDQNRRVIETLMNPPKNWEFICLLGNHEDMLLEAILYRREHMVYDPNILKEFSSKYSISDQLEEFPDDIVEWMQNLKLCHIEGENIFAHAWYDSTKRIEDQLKTGVIWERMDDFEKWSEDHRFLTHGHTPRRNGPVLSPNRVNLDCGVYTYNRYVIGEYEENVKGPVKFHEFLL